MNHRDILRRVWLFADLNDLREITKLAKVRRCEPGHIVFHQGDRSGDLFAVLTGRLKVSAGNTNGDEVLLSILGPGDVFGEIALLDDEPRSATVSTIEPCELLVIEKVAFRGLLTRDPDLSLNLMRVLARRLRELSNRTEDVSLLNVESRLAKTIGALAQRFGARGSQGQITLALHLSQQELADMVGATREFVNRCLRGWAKKNILDFERGHIVIRDAEALKDRASDEANG